MIASAVIASLALSAIATGKSRVVHCPHVRGYYGVTVRNITCKRAGHILWLARQSSGTENDIQGFECRVISRVPGGGFPADMRCTKGRVHAQGGIFDGPA